MSERRPPITNFPTPAPSLESLTTSTLVVSTASATPTSAPATPTSAPATPPSTKANHVNIAAGLGAFAVLVFFGFVCILFACKHLRRLRRGRLNNGEWDYNNGRETVQLESAPQPLPAPQPLAAVVSVQDETELKVAYDQPAAICSPTVLNFDEAGQEEPNPPFAKRSRARLKKKKSLSRMQFICTYQNHIGKMVLSRVRVTNLEVPHDDKSQQTLQLFQPSQSQCV
ncbi:Hypothetical predicted protein [Cloeon dipterum]|uniref:Uncharacterized protein n=1 Tax=Cloeon dipterum TaxID=197152 RepID=A0A8S1E1T9_9INSE|nr:Hypothetical predicted protein [Cloeon dipterum]